MVDNRADDVIQHAILLTKTTAAQNEVAFSYHEVRGLYFLAVVFEATIVLMDWGWIKGIIIREIEKK